MNVTDPFELFSNWLADSKAAGSVLPHAMALATTDIHGAPDVRMVMLRSFTPTGFAFFTDRKSAKGNQLRANPQAVLLGYWRELGRQVRVSGTVSETTPEEDDSAFGERPRDAKLAIAAWQQGSAIGDTEKLYDTVRALEQRLLDGVIKRPSRWGGYRLLPNRFVFWEERPGHIHWSQAYHHAEDGSWNRSLIAP